MRGGYARRQRAERKRQVREETRQMAGPERGSDGERSEEEAAAAANRDEDGGRADADDQASEESSLRTSISASASDAR